MSVALSPETDQLFAALKAARTEFPAIQKNAENPFFQAKFADYNSIRDAVDPILEKHGLLISQFPDTTEQGDSALCLRLHRLQLSRLWLWEQKVCLQVLQRAS